jgi:hypothetical protein
VHNIQPFEKYGKLIALHKEAESPRDFHGFTLIMTFSKGPGIDKRNNLGKRR